MVKKITLFLARSMREHLSKLIEDTESSPEYTRAMELYGDLIVCGTSPYQYGLYGLTSARKDPRINEFFESGEILDSVFRGSQRIEAHVMYLDRREPRGVRLELRAYPKNATKPWAIYVFTFAQGQCISIEQSEDTHAIVEVNLGMH